MGSLKVHNYFDVPPPLIFNPLKHHLGYIRQFITDAVNLKPGDSELEEILSGIGAPMTDIYLGTLSVQEILDTVSTELLEKKTFNLSSYREWLNNEKKYRFMVLPDASKWILLEGRNTDRYIHFHPAKYSEHAFRVRGSTLRTVIAVKIKGADQPGNWFNVDFVNEIRSSLLGLSPVKRIVRNKGIGRLMQMV
ncbi:hypothetical protein [Prolixibacter denitrificans]|uniref:Uncharacterized protein n=1 Tax=Prolixibacter denitrificans TaxID=1541063 RepID=A0A2P8CG64_9BACT|nr:hypothetical protein [Prolixibacter denitrificans]PSK83954.1 hypothetical protein CLV93_103379 [Prolixibacter denitrificans]GET23495.1 hypothetical protein JCM18694_37410 [Prolixibacter denitrificans]